MQIAAITIYTADLPLADPFQHASSGLIDVLKEVVVKVETDEGAVGWSEVRGNAPYVTGETQGRVVAILRELLAPKVLLLEDAAPAALPRQLDAIVPGNTTAKAAIDIAVHDAAAKIAGLPLRQMLGGGGGNCVHIHGTLPFCTAEAAGHQALAYLDQGITTIKVRLGLPAFADDLARLRAVRAAIADHARAADAVIAADVNQGWGSKEALAKAKRLSENDLGFTLAWLEQPVSAADINALKAVRETVDIPVFADEACGTPQDLLALIRANAVDGVHLKLCKAGGIRRLMGMVALAEAAGLPYLMGQMDEGMLATAAALQCAAASSPLSCELWGYQRVGSQPFYGITMVDGDMRLSPDPGLGVTIDEARLTLIERIERPQS
ncbi:MULTISPECIES: enolase C-terminal domain-like protein [unclassified Chelatococcus]|uniref:mandelate racemase/muconate lactonizing enzyme family protein n=1 Tax=unclassified Chelatococcus TaxID=2638111 RepID=UPI001BCB22CC|nr:MULTISPECIES: enolase C-terminal domain-like protein [unclassified Chelatococcus]MBS7699858.1 hypothetical protein [Chelatococcus sp. YT9]MBX3558796.1 hypothetical protein [Chelatococcus sp.]